MDEDLDLITRTEAGDREAFAGHVYRNRADRETVICAEIDRDYQDRVRRELPCLGHVKLAR